MTTSQPATPDALSVANLVPVAEKERILLLDSLRGIALLGILLMNIPGFALPFGQVFDAAVKNEMSGINFYTYYFFEWLLEGSQRAIFSMLFGAGMLLFIGRLEKKTEGLMVAEYYFRRQLWLLLFGLFNAYILLWFWDILYAYAILGMFIFPFRRLPPKALLIAASVCVVALTVRENVNFMRERKVVIEGEAIAAMDTTQVKLSTDQKAALQEMLNIKQRSTIESRVKRIEKNTAQVLGSYGDLYDVHGNHSYNGETNGMFNFLFWDILTCMFIGMAFFKLGFLTGEYRGNLYAWMALVGLGVGLVLSYFRLKPGIDLQFNYFEVLKDGGFQFYQLSRVFRAMGIFGLIMLLYHSGWFDWLFRMMRPVGRMAFTNYLMQSLLCGLIFYGVGFGLFGKLQRFEIYYVLAGVWAFQIVFSNIWLRYFLFGPMEWLWRCLTYWKLQPFVRSEPALRAQVSGQS
jgi:uncharacterized protein